LFHRDAARNYRDLFQPCNAPTEFALDYREPQSKDALAAVQKFLDQDLKPAS
jgi:hypothetical protein